MRTIELLRKYVMSENPVNIQVLSDQESNFSLCVRRGPCAPVRRRSRYARSSNKRVNYEDPNFNIGLPIFIIHGAPRLHRGVAGARLFWRQPEPELFGAQATTTNPPALTTCRPSTS